jgi:hypothetical protein
LVQVQPEELKRITFTIICEIKTIFEVIQLKKAYMKIYEYFFNFLKKFFSVTKENFRKFDKQYPYTSETIQLSFIYFFALVDLIYSIATNMFSLGFIPEIIMPFFPFINGILQSPILKIWASPEKVFFMSYVVLELMVIRSVLKLSKFVRYNILLVFALLMLQGLLVSVWDLLFHREITAAVANWAYDDGLVIGTNRKLAGFFFFLTFLGFIGLYSYFYTKALGRKIATLPGLYWMTDSVAFWLRIKTPTMKFGGKDTKKDSESD